MKALVGQWPLRGQHVTNTHPAHQPKLISDSPLLRTGAVLFSCIHQSRKSAVFAADVTVSAAPGFEKKKKPQKPWIQERTRNTTFNFIPNIGLGNNLCQAWWMKL